ncbi:hypothetical protein [Endozoicomonas sp. GU-1]|uniref:hypothetical protein n=1 Tax=Endozoicomonas sp. GU-1 TaxID=3009078 RepID=UPI0022B3717A|nr:hypothetical protein [Endozoicomonas sp. GU-1]WBA83181.1 hypothetical protein O2T12_08720 [Endozoicomonas sp. GU-1]WBA86107.1 hypothetical protein O3276_23355 [Endozoicomonas sp. GU-1]
MQPFSSTYVPLSGAPGNSHLNEPAKTNPTGTLGKFAVAVQSGVTTFFRSLSPNYVPEHQRHISQPTAPVASTVSADHKNDKTSLADNVVQGVGLASKALSCWVPNASAVGDAIGTICSYVSLANRLDDMAVSGKSGKPGKESTIGSENVSKDPSQKVTDKKQEDEKPGKPVTASGTTNRVSGPAMATVTLMAMDRLAGAAARPIAGSAEDRNDTKIDNTNTSRHRQNLTTTARPTGTETINVTTTNAAPSSSSNATNTTPGSSTQPPKTTVTTRIGTSPTTDNSTAPSTTNNATNTTPGSSTQPPKTNVTIGTGSSLTIHNSTVPSTSINATITPTTPLATAAMAPPVMPAPLAGTISPWVVVGVSLGTAVTIVAGIGLCALSQYYHRRDEARQQAEPEIPLEPLNQQANN